MSINRRRFVGAPARRLAAPGLPVGRAGAQERPAARHHQDHHRLPARRHLRHALPPRRREPARRHLHQERAGREQAGRGGQIAVQSMKGAPTDGSVLLQTPASMLMIYPHIYKNLAYNAFTDVTAVSQACTFDFGFCVGPAVPDSVKNIPEFLGAKPTRTRPTMVRLQRVRCRTSSACCWARRAASS